MLRTLSVLICLILFVHPLAASSQQQIDVSIMQLIANSDAYHGKYVRLIGFVKLEFEGNAIYLHQDDYKFGISKNGLWLDITEEITKSMTRSMYSLKAPSTPKIKAIESENVKIPQALRRIGDADPAKDFDEAIKNRDFRFVGIHGYALIVPGVENYYERYEKSNGVKTIEGTGDVILNEEHEQLQNKARSYAEKYNMLLLKFLGAQK